MTPSHQITHVIKPPSVTAGRSVQQFVSVLPCVQPESGQSGSPVVYFSLEQRLPLSSDMTSCSFVSDLRGQGDSFVEMKQSSAAFTCT